jgi:hypothetical protein
MHAVAQNHSEQNVQRLSAAQTLLVLKGLNVLSEPFGRTRKSFSFKLIHGCQQQIRDIMFHGGGRNENHSAISHS